MGVLGFAFKELTALWVEGEVSVQNHHRVDSLASNLPVPILGTSCHNCVLVHTHTHTD